MIAIQPKHNTLNRRQRGLTLVELMIALVLGLIVVGGSLAVFLSQRVSSTLSAQMADVQSEGRIALDAMARDLRAAGDFGCWPVTNPIDERLNNKTALDADQGGILGFDKLADVPADASGHYGLAKVKDSMPNDLTDLAKNSSVVAFVGISGSLSVLSTAMGSQAADLVIKKPLELFKSNDLAVVTDCINWAKFEVTSVTVPDASGTTQTLKHEAGETSSFGKGNLDGNIGELFGVGASVGRLDSVWWFMGKVNGQSGLFRLSARDNVPVLVSSRVAAISVNYDLSNSANGSVTDAGKTAAQVEASANKWTSVRSATISMLMRSEKVGNAGQQTATSFNGQSVSSDSHVYLPLQMTIALRNQ
ncbi:PilW family protein [Uliginosibacterium sp. 31-12]|uniref:PilW family protein n=1 Tax=Uliginosibacterium sp. 31-12 TaxID=3062781 RepID=UPI0026E3991F|nr:prepilin-type N-terminal cleavage/methylation domain-containing protein [Uliginosibacterium sp. 31-12]MDO6385026.1 prepilin-type N-terminal cleavage/methylation domain-containing protein [Uliginosibacterium sp. 31-12]